MATRGVLSRDNNKSSEGGVVHKFNLVCDKSLRLVNEHRANMIKGKYLDADF